MRAGNRPGRRRRPPRRARRAGVLPGRREQRLPAGLQQGQQPRRGLRLGGGAAYLGQFRVGSAPHIDPVQGTLGLDVLNVPAGRHFPKGVLVVQDSADTPEPAGAGLKLVRWDTAARLLGLAVSPRGWAPR
ncbi:phytase [Nonomuraea antimicrobica]